MTWTLLAGILCHHHTCLVYWAGTQRDRRIEGGFEQFDGHLVEATQEVAALPRAGRRRGARVVGPSIKRQWAIVYRARQYTCLCGVNLRVQIRPQGGSTWNSGPSIVTTTSTAASAAACASCSRRESVLFIGTQFSNLYTAVDTPARGRVIQLSSKSPITTETARAQLVAAKTR